MKANHPKPIANKSTNTTKSVGKTNSKSTTNVSQPSIKSQTTDNNFSKTPWTAQSALDFLQKVNDFSSAGERVVGEKYAKYLSSSDAGNFPGNSIFLLENNRSGAGDGGVVLTKNADNTVTLTIGEGAASWPVLKAIVDAKTYKVLSQTDINNDMSNRKSMWEYFGIKEPGENQTNKDDSASNDNHSSDDKQSNNNDDTSSDNQDNSSTNDTNSDSNNDNSQNSDTKQSNDDSNNN